MTRIKCVLPRPNLFATPPSIILEQRVYLRMSFTDNGVLPARMVGERGHVPSRQRVSPAISIGCRMTQRWKAKSSSSRQFRIFKPTFHVRRGPPPLQSKRKRGQAQGQQRQRPQQNSRDVGLLSLLIPHCSLFRLVARIRSGHPQPEITIRVPKLFKEFLRCESQSVQAIAQSNHTVKSQSN